MERAPDRALERVAWDIAKVAFSDIAARYGKHSRKSLPYHDDFHARDVTSYTTAILSLAAEREKVPYQSIIRGILAGSHHDFRQDLGSGENERASVDALVGRMRESGVFTCEDETSVTRMILGTRVVFDGGRIIQAVPLGHTPEDLEVQALADADLANLGDTTEVYWKNSVNYFTEIYGPNPSIDEQIEFMQNQVVLLETHEFYTQEARDLFPHQPKNLTYTKDVFEAVLAPAA